LKIYLGKQELFYSVTDGWGYVAIEDMIINNVESGPIQDVLTSVFSEANAPIVILPSHVINGLCKYSNKHYLQVMTPFHASELLAKNSSILLRLTSEQKLSLLKYIILNDPDPSLVLELELLPLANNTFITFQTKQASIIYIVDRNSDFLNLFHVGQHNRFLNPNIDQDLFDKLSSKTFQGNEFFPILLLFDLHLTVFFFLFYFFFFIVGFKKKSEEAKRNGSKDFLFLLYSSYFCFEHIFLFFPVYLVSFNRVDFFIQTTSTHRKEVKEEEEKIEH